MCVHCNRSNGQTISDDARTAEIRRPTVPAENNPHRAKTEISKGLFGLFIFYAHAPSLSLSLFLPSSYPFVHQLHIPLFSTVHVRFFLAFINKQCLCRSIFLLFILTTLTSILIIQSDRQSAPLSRGTIPYARVTV